MARYSILSVILLLLFTQCKKDENSGKSPVVAGGFDTLGISWTTTSRNNIMYYFQGDVSTNDVIKYADQRDAAYETLNAYFQSQHPSQIRFFVWTDRDLAQQKLGRPLGFAVPQQCITHSYIGQTLGHEMTHILSYWAWGVVPTDYSKFVNEGLAVAFDLNTTNKLDVAKSAIAGKNIPGIKAVWDGSYTVSDDILYPLGGAFMQYLKDQNMAEEFKQLIKKQSLASAENIYGKSKLDSLIANFETMVGL